MKAARRCLIMLGLAAPLARIAPARAATVEGGTPPRLPLAAIDDLDIDPDALIDEQPVRLAALSLGALTVTSGRVAGVDALLLDGAPYTDRVPDGRHPVELVLAGLPSGEERAALLVVRFAQRAAVRWDNALIEGEDAAALGPDELSVFGVESGVAALFDAAALVAWRAELAASRGALAALERVLRQNRRPVWTWTRVTAGSGSGVLVTAGMGAGEVAAYWGRDAAGERVALALDFDLLDWAGLPEDEPTTT
jgi:hypothetical protein